MSSLSERSDRVIRQTFGVPPQLTRTILSIAGRSIRWHRWAPNSQDGPEHAHPWPFITIVWRGGYTDLTAEGAERVEAPAVRYRRAEHRHRIVAGSRGCSSVVLTGRMR